MFLLFKLYTVIKEAEIKKFFTTFYVYNLMEMKEVKGKKDEIEKIQENIIHGRD